MERHYCHLHFALLISTSTEQLAISSLLPLFLLQRELLIFAQRKLTVGIILQWYKADKNLISHDSCFLYKTAVAP